MPPRNLASSLGQLGYLPRLTVRTDGSFGAELSLLFSPSHDSLDRLAGSPAYTTIFILLKFP